MLSNPGAWWWMCSCPTKEIFLNFLKFYVQSENLNGEKKKKNHLLASFNIKLCQDFWSRVCLSSLMSIVSFRWLSGWLPTALASSFLPPQSSWYISYGCVLCWTVLPLTKVCKTSTLARHLGHFSGLEVMNGVASWLITVACSSNCAVVCCGE